MYTGKGSRSVGYPYPSIGCPKMGLIRDGDLALEECRARNLSHILFDEEYRAEL